jgi:thiamine monophosphate synthase
LHDAREAASTVARESLFVIFGHVFATPSKPGVPPRGLVALAEVVRAAAPTPVVAIGGVNARNSHEIQAAGAWGWASIRSAFTPTFDQPAA